MNGVRALIGHMVRAFFRDPVAAFFTLMFPLIFLCIVASLVGDDDAGDGVRVVQYLVPPFAVFGVAQASFVLVAVATAALRDSGALLRLRSAPVPPWAVPVARIVTSLAVSGIAVALLVAVGVIGYDVSIVGRKVPAMLVTLILGVACCSSLGYALAALTRTVLAAQTLAQGLLISLSFISDVFIVGADLPRWLEVIGSVLPLKHFAHALVATFEPTAGYGSAPGHLAVMLGWTAAGILIAVRRAGRLPAYTAATVPAGEDKPAGRLPGRTVSHHRSPAGVLAVQVGYALLGMRRDLLSVFFAVVFPALLLALFPTVFGDTRVHGLPMAQYLFAGMIAYTVAVTTFVDLPEAVAGARAAGVLKRLRGTPVSFAWYFAGRVVAAVVVASVATGVLTVVGAGFLGVRLPLMGVPALLLAIAVGGLCFAALGLAVIALMANSRSVLAVTLGTLLPLCFVSEIFVVGDRPLPGWITTVAGFLPLRHLLDAVLAATGPAAGGRLALGHLSVLLAWAVAGSLVVWRRRVVLG